MARFGTDPASTNSGAVVNYELNTPAYAAALTLSPNAFGSNFIPGDLTGALALTIDAANAQEADKLICVVKGSGAARIVTLTGDVISDGTRTAADAKQATIEFIFDGTNYVETSRFVQP